MKINDKLSNNEIQELIKNHGLTFTKFFNNFYSLIHTKELPFTLINKFEKSTDKLRKLKKRQFLNRLRKNKDKSRNKGINIIKLNFPSI